jgi:hypothetical protein
MGTFKTLIAVVVTAAALFVAEATAQTATPPAGQPPVPSAEMPARAADMPARGEEKRVEGQVKAIDPSRTEITLADDTKLLMPPGSTLKPGDLSEGAHVIASYREQNGSKILTELAVRGPAASSSPAASPPTEPHPTLRR